ncbi:MAG: hypothetical protein H6807_03025 [Planctomycetes bacterium]|nr:hypothetical protein [Planctomycetota bacterium]
MRSATCVPERRGAAVALCLLVFLAACGDATPKTDTAAVDFGALLTDLANRQLAVLDARKSLRDAPFFVGTAVLDELRTLDPRIDICSRNLNELAEYDLEADRQGLPEADRLRYKEVALEALRRNLDQNEKAFAALRELRARDEEVFSLTWGKLQHANQVLGDLIEAGIPAYEIQPLLRDLSQRLLDARRYWCQELANALRGLEPSADVLALARGSIGQLAREVEPVATKMNLAGADFTRITNGRDGLAARLDWSRRTLAELPEDDPLRRAAAPGLEAIAVEIAALAERAGQEILQVLDTAPTALEHRDDFVREQSALLSRLNEIVLVEAQKRGLPLPR